jgi:hypothetical protein
MGTGHKCIKNQICMYGRRKRILKFDREEIKPCTECTYLDTKIDQLGHNTTDNKTDNTI